MINKPITNIIIPPIKWEYFPNLFEIAFISKVFIAIMNITISSIKKKKTYNNEYKTWPVLEMLLTASISLNMTGKPREHKSSMTFTENARKTTPSKASIKDFSL